MANEKLVLGMLSNEPLDDTGKLGSIEYSSTYDEASATALQLKVISSNG